MITSTSAFPLIFSLIFVIPHVYAQTAASLAYTPQSVTCPDVTQFIRLAGSGQNQTLSPQELNYLTSRRNGTLPGAWQTYLNNVQGAASSQGVALPDYVTSILNGSTSSTDLPTLGIAVSGGGYRAATFSAAFLNSLDARNGAAAGFGTGGLLQAATYLVGSSAGSWVVGSLSQAGFPTMSDLVVGPGSPPSSNTTNTTTFGDWGGWTTQFGFLNPSPVNSQDVQSQYYQTVLSEISGKAQAGFPVSFADLWSRVLARHFVNGTNATNFFDFVNATNSTQQPHGAGALWSGLTSVSTFQTNQQPFPIIVVDSLSSSQSNGQSNSPTIVPLTNTIYEFNPFEMGSYDPTLSAFIPTSLLGSTPNSSGANGQTVNGTNGANGANGTSSGNGQAGVGGNGGIGTPGEPANGQNVTGADGANGTSTTGGSGGTSGNGTCVTGYDQTSFVMSLSSNLFNALNQTSGQLSDSVLGPVVPFLNNSFQNSPSDFLPGYIPNSFQGVAAGSFPDSQSPQLTLVDGDEDGEFVPFQPLLVAARNVDVIFASDASSQTPDNYPNGTALINAAARAQAYPDSYTFPPVPSSADDIVSSGFNLRPVFFGCGSADNGTSTTTPTNDTSPTNGTTSTNSTTPASGTPIPPLVIYLPNMALPNDIALTNSSTFQDTLLPASVQAILTQANSIVTRGFINSSFALQAQSTNPTVASDPMWPVCLACAVTDRARARQGLPRDGVCSTCLQQYCFS